MYGKGDGIVVDIQITRHGKPVAVISGP